MEQRRGSTKPHLPTFVACLQPKQQALNAALIVHKYSPLDATLNSLESWISVLTRRCHNIHVSRAAVFTAVFPGRGSEHKQCLGWRVWGQFWRRLGALALVWPAPVLHMSGSPLVILEAVGGRQRVRLTWCKELEECSVNRHSFTFCSP